MSREWKLLLCSWTKLLMCRIRGSLLRMKNWNRMFAWWNYVGGLGEPIGTILLKNLTNSLKQVLYQSIRSDLNICMH